MESILPKGLPELIEKSEQALSAFNKSNPGAHFTLFAKAVAEKCTKDRL